MLITRSTNCNTFLDGRVAWLRRNGETEENEWTINLGQHDIWFRNLWNYELRLWIAISLSIVYILSHLHLHCISQFSRVIVHFEISNTICILVITFCNRYQSNITIKLLASNVLLNCLADVVLSLIHISEPTRPY